MKIIFNPLPGWHKRPYSVYRVFVGPVEISGYYTNLARGFRENGVHCDFVTYDRHPFEYGGDSKKPILLSLADFLKGFRGKLGMRLIERILITLPGQALQWVWAISAMFKYDVFIFGFGHSLLPRNLDLIVLKFIGKIVISNLGHGSDARPPYIDGAYQSSDGSSRPTTDELLSFSQAKLKKVEFFQKFSDVIIGAPFTTSHFSSKGYVNWFAVGLPQFFANPNDVNIDDGDAKACIAPSSDIRILHSPSHSAGKGSPLIIKAIANLKRKGYQIELILLQNKAHSEVLREIQCCDFVVDQVYSDTPMASFATEAAWFGKPAVVGGYGFEALKKLVPEGMWPPSMTCHPDTIDQAIEYLIVNRNKRLQLGVEAQRFVHEKWSAVAVARRFLRLIEGDIPEEWWLDPGTVTYLEGFGQPVERTQENIRQMVLRFGVESLQLSHRPALELAFLEFAGVRGAH